MMEKNPFLWGILKAKFVIKTKTKKINNENVTQST